MAINPSLDYVRGGGVRETPPAQTLERASRFGRRLGISRVTDITRLDRLGIPVCVSVRPGALNDSLSVNAGKGVTSEDARVGAWMEGIEFALFEPDAPCAQPQRLVAAQVKDVLGGTQSLHGLTGFALAAAREAIANMVHLTGGSPAAVASAEATLPFFTLGPRADMAVSPNTPLPCVIAEDFVGGEPWGECLLPVDFAYLPRPPAFASLPAYFVGSTNGLASGNTVREATAHALCEVIERDVLAFMAVDRARRPRSVRATSLPTSVAALVKAVESAGIRVCVHWHPNEFGIAHFGAILFDEEQPTEPASIAYGYGCHPRADIAVTRALCEAAQTRLGYIHGGRDDLPELSAAYLAGGLDATAARFERIRKRYRREEEESVNFQTVPDFPEVSTVPACLDVLLAALARVGLQRFCRLRYTSDTDPVQVVKVVVPGLECNQGGPLQVGPRLYQVLHNQQRSGKGISDAY